MINNQLVDPVYLERLLKELTVEEAVEEFRQIMYREMSKVDWLNTNGFFGEEPKFTTIYTTSLSRLA